MCGLCSKDEKVRQAAIASYRHYAKLFEQMANVELRLATGLTQPHGGDTKKYVTTARALIRYLVDNWM